MKSESTSYVKQEQEKIVPYQLIHPKGFNNNNILPEDRWIVNTFFASAWRFNKTRSKDTSSKIYLRDNVSHSYKDDIAEEKIIKIPYIDFYKRENYFKYGNYTVSVTHFSSVLIEQKDEKQDSLFCVVIRVADESLLRCMEYAFSNYIPSRVTWPTQTFNRTSGQNREERSINNIKSLCIPNVSFFPITKPRGNELRIINELEDEAQEVIKFEKISIESDKSNIFWEWPTEYCTWKYQEQYINTRRKFLKLSNEEKTEDELSNQKKKWSLNFNPISVDIDLMTGGRWSITRPFPTIISYTEQSTIVNSNSKLSNFKLLIILFIIILISLFYLLTLIS